MPNKTIFSIIESPLHPNLSSLYHRLGFEEIKPRSIRDALKQIKNIQPVYIVADFFYAYGSNYSGVHISNLDVLFVSLQKYSIDTRVIVFAQKDEKQYIEKFCTMFPVYKSFIYPATEQQIEKALMQ